MIPEHCIDTFVKKFKIYPSIIEISSQYTTNGDDAKYLNILKYFEKFDLLWFNYYVDDNGNTTLPSRLYEYDSTGIIVYINVQRKIFILTTVDRKSVSEYLINNLKKIK
jgi:hypothetical protein